MKKFMCNVCNHTLTCNADKICHFCRVKLKGVKSGFKNKEVQER